MPEMPEVEQVRKTLAPHIEGHTITRVQVDLERMIQHPGVAEFIKQVTGKKIEGLSRRGKYLALHLDSGCYILAHLRMTGALIAQPAAAPAPAYAKVKFTLDGEENLWFTDIRTFGTLYLINPKEEYRVKSYETLGPEPLSKEFTVAYLAPKAKRSKKPIKTFILEQSIIAGLGNIYADECLALAKILPMRPANTLAEADIKRLWEAINTVIAQGIKNHGTTFRDYKDGNGEQGENQKHLLVYSRKGKPCTFCGAALVQTKIGGRGSVYCEHCQK